MKPDVVSKKILNRLPIYPDYLKDKVAESENLIEIPSHNSISKNPFEKIECRYAILENLI